MTEFFRVDYSGHVAEIVLNQPKRLNVISPAWSSSLSLILDEVEKNDNVRVILIWAEGKLFTAGIDLSLLPNIGIRSSECVGGGVDLVCSCDIRLCTSDASFSIKETQVGLVADLGTIPYITKIVGKGIYSEMVFKTKEELLVGARSLCSKISENSPLVVQGAKTVLMFAEEHTTDDALDYVGFWNSSFLDSEDLQEAITAFVQKRKPKFNCKL